MLDASLKDQLQAHLARITQPVTLIATRKKHVGESRGRQRHRP